MILKKLHINVFLYKYLKELKKYKAQSTMTVQEAGAILKRYALPSVNVRANRENLKYSNEYDLAVIVPVYNGEKSIKKCINSILRQTNKYKIQVIIINDGSKDKTEKELEHFLKLENVYYRSKENGGLSSARNQGLDLVNSKYIMFLDADDELYYKGGTGGGCLESLLDTAIVTNADIVEGSLCRKMGFLKKIIWHKNQDNVNPLVDFYGYCCGKVIKSSCLYDLEFPEGMIYEDTIFTFLLYPRTRHATIISDLVYIYNVNLKGIDFQSIKSSKCLHTYAILIGMLNELEHYKIEKTQDLYENILKQLHLNGIRVCNMDTKLQESVFLMSADHIGKSFPGFYSQTEKGRILEEIILKKNFKKYQLFCRLIQL